MPEPEPEPDAFLRICPSRGLLERLGEKWAMLAVVALKEDAMRFGQLMRRLEGVSQKMLTQTLRRLERDGMVRRQVFDEMPLRVEYSLTQRGLDVVPLVESLKAWAEANLHAVERDNLAYDQKRETTQ